MEQLFFKSVQVVGWAHLLVLVLGFEEVLAAVDLFLGKLFTIDKIKSHHGSVVL